MDEFKVGDRVVLVRPDGFDKKERGLSGGEVGTVVEDGTLGFQGMTRVMLDGGTCGWVFEHGQLDLATPPERDDRRERIAAAVLAGFAADGSTVGMSGAVLAREAVKWADALIEELSK